MKTDSASVVAIQQVAGQWLMVQDSKENVDADF
jgi:hypothetical protein